MVGCGGGISEMLEIVESLKSFYMIDTLFIYLFIEIKNPMAT